MLALTWRRRTTLILITGFIAILVALVVVYIVSNFAPRTDIQLGSTVYRVKVADTLDLRYKGLSGSVFSRSDDGLLMVYPNDDKHSIVMRDMKMNLDIIWLDKNQKVIHIVKDASPETGEDVVYVSQKPARYVLEVAAGSTSKNSIKVGSIASFNVVGATE
jgi:uncharacterized membrane protein (UPF0127 family)